MGQVVVEFDCDGNVVAVDEEASLPRRVVSTDFADGVPADPVVQAQVVDLLRDLQRAHGLAYLFISHDLKVVRALANDVIVMRNGKVVESGPSRQIFDHPQTDYTRALMAAAFEMKAVDTGAVSE